MSYERIKCPHCHNLLVVYKRLNDGLIASLDCESCPINYRERNLLKHSISFETKDFFIISYTVSKSISVYPRSNRMKHYITIPYFEIDFSNLDNFNNKLLKLITFS